MPTLIAEDLEHDEFNAMRSQTKQEIEHQVIKPGEIANRNFGIVFGLFQIAFIIFYGVGTKYDENTDPKMDDLEATGGAEMSRYTMWQDIHVMIFVGFGFLMTFLRSHGFSSLTENFLVGIFAIQWGILTTGFFSAAYDHGIERIPLHLTQLVEGDFAAACSLISLGAVLGKVTPIQALWMVFFELFFYAWNYQIGVTKLGGADIGGTIFLHTFGAYFGLAVSWAVNYFSELAVPLARRRMNEKLFDELDTNGDGVLTLEEVQEGADKLGMSVQEATEMFFKLDDNGDGVITPNELVGGHIENSSSYSSDMFAMIGTLFLWIFWPSFVSVLADNNAQNRCVMHTVLALCGSCMMACVVSNIYRPHHKFNMVDVQNATLAGGVTIGAVADHHLGGHGALIIGSLAGALSAIGYIFIMPYLEETIGLYDTCGVHNLHGMPGVLGGICSIITASMVKDSLYGDNAGDVFSKMGGENGRSAGKQALAQFGGLMITLIISIASGLLTGWVISQRNWFDPPAELFNDAVYFHVPGLDGPELGVEADALDNSEHRHHHHNEKVVVGGWKDQGLQDPYQLKAKLEAAEEKGL
jgi:ammonium transporter Rh